MIKGAERLLATAPFMTDGYFLNRINFCKKIIGYSLSFLSGGNANSNCAVTFLSLLM